MGQCAQTNGSSSGVVPSSSPAKAPLGYPLKTKNKESPSQPTLRGLDLIKSCAKFYENGVGMANPTIQLLHSVGGAVNKPCTRRTSPSRLSKGSIGTVAVMCSFFLVLPSLALATIVWWGATKTEAVGGPEVAANNASAESAQLGNPAITTPGTLRAAAGAQTISNIPSDIIVHKVRTQPITVDARGRSGPR
jgi:hypothetical protein